MGALSGFGQSTAQMFAGSGSAEELARRSLGWGSIATGLDVGDYAVLSVDDAHRALAPLSRFKARVWCPSGQWYTWKVETPVR